MSRRLAAMRLSAEDCVLIVIDLQDKFLQAIPERDRVLNHSIALVQVALELEVPIIVTEQVPEKLGNTDPGLAEILRGQNQSPIAKSSFSCWASPEFQSQLKHLNRRTAVLVGVETHICVASTALDLIENQYEVTVCPDAVAARSTERHKLGMERVRDAGAMPAHVESVIYEWLNRADHPLFKRCLPVIKSID